MLNVGTIAQLHNLFVQAKLPQERKFNLTNFTDGSTRISFMDNEGEVRYYDVTREGNLIEFHR